MISEAPDRALNLMCVFQSDSCVSSGLKQRFLLPNVLLLFGIMSSKSMSYYSSMKKFEKFELFFFGLHLLSGEKMDMMTFFFGLHLHSGKKMYLCGLSDFFFGLHLLLSEKMGTCRLNDLFFGLHLILGEKLDICQYDDSQRPCPPFA